MSDIHAEEINVGELVRENEVLKNRCRALTHGLICQSCKIKCNNRTREFGDWSGIDIPEEDEDNVDKA